jgi:hypothetical protein
VEFLVESRRKSGWGTDGRSKEDSRGSGTLAWLPNRSVDNPVSLPLFSQTIIEEKGTLVEISTLSTDTDPTTENREEEDPFF